MARPLAAMLTACCLLLWAPGGSATEPFIYRGPAFLGPAVVSRAASGNTWTFRGTAEYAEARLLITLVEPPSGLPRDDTGACAEAFLVEIRSRIKDAFWRQESHPLRAAGSTLDAWRWAGAFDGAPRTGVIGCGVLGSRFLVVAMEDSIEGAPLSFPALRRSLATLDFD